MDVVPLTQVPDDPVWQAQPTSSVQLTVGSVSEYTVPRAGEWEVAEQRTWPAIVTQEGDHYVLYGTHRIVHRFRRQWPADCDGINRWDIENNTMETRKFTEHSGIGGYVFAASIPGNEGPAFCQITLNTDESGNPVPADSESLYTVFVYDTNGKEIASIEPNIKHSGLLDFVNWRPLEYPDTHLFALRVSNDRSFGCDSYIFDFSNGESRLDLRSGNSNFPHNPVVWLADTGEWLFLKDETADGQKQSAILVVQKNFTAMTMSPWTWQGFAWKNADEYNIGMPRVGPYTWQDHRYLLFSSTPNAQPVAMQWAVRLDPGAASGEPVWARQEPSDLRAEEQILLLGPDKHPFWVRFYGLSKTLRVIDLVSGKLVINVPVDVAMPSLNPIPNAQVMASTFGATLALRLKQDAGIPAVFIFDQNAGKLFRIDLKLPT
jgi:hypothetical protein